MEEILTTKLYIPNIRKELVPRPHLIDRLNEGLYRKLSLISAPAGFGKTTLVSEWVKHLQSISTKEKEYKNRIAWLSLDNNDNDPARFITYLIAALQIFDSNIGQKAHTVFQSQQQLLIEPILMTLVNDIAQHTGHPSNDSHKDFVLILDDYHVIEEPTINQAIEYLIEHQPPNLHLVIITRIDPFFSLSRLRVRDQLLEIRSINLHFTESDVKNFFNETMKMDLSPEEIALLESRTEGWIAGLQLAAISLQGRVNRQEFIQTFSGDNRLVIDFLLDEVLLKQTEDVRRFLLQTSILDSMCGSLCDAVVNLPDERSQINGQDFLENLERANLFIVPLDNQREWYRYHHLFSEALQNRLRKTMDSKLALIHMSASKWFEDEGDYDNALQHALAAGNLDKAALLVEQNALNLLVHSRLTKLKKWYEALPNDKIYSFPELCILRGWLHILIGTVEDANRCVQRTEELLKSASLQDKSTENRIYGYIYGLKARIALRIRDLPKAKEYADQTLEYIIARSPTHSHVAVIKGLAAFWEGDLENADAALQEAISISIECDHRFMSVEASIWLGYIKTIQGRLQKAVGYYKDALEYAELGGRQKIPIAGSAYIGLALVERERNNLGDAENLLMNGFDLCYLFGNPQAWHIAMAQVKRAKGNYYDAIEELRIAERLGVGSEVAFDNLKINVSRVSQWLSPVGGNLNEAKRWANDYRLQLEDFPSFTNRVEYMMLARVLIVQGEMDNASSLLTRLQDDTETGARKGDLIAILALQALSLHALGKSDQAVTILERALTLAKPEGFIRIFVDEGPPMATMLYETLKREIEPEYVQRLLAAFPLEEPEQDTPPQTPGSELIEPLSDRELEVLQLLAKGLSNQEIATRLYLSKHTVKVHARNIYGKLGVGNRAQAGDKARVLGLLSMD